MLKNRSIPIFLLGFFFINLTIAQAQELTIDTSLAYQYFQEARAIAGQDNGKLWGVVLQGPMLFADPKTRMVVATENNREGTLTKKRNVFIGKLPDNINIADTATEWAGVKWTMVRWPLPENKQERAGLMMHELWHRVQDQIGFPATSSANNHLDAPAGRIWLKLEWSALRSAVIQDGEKRKEAIRDALVFRQRRHELFSTAAKEERELEMHEGLAQYTGMKLSGRSNSETIKAIVQQLESTEKNETFVRSFAYASGPAYGFLLDGSTEDWLKNLKPEQDFGTLLQKLFSISLPENVAAEAELRSQKYHGSEIRAKEEEREKNRQKRIAVYRKKFIEDPLLILPLQKMNIQINPANLQPLDSLGTVYPTIRITDLWGILNVTEGALMSPTWTNVRVSMPANLTDRPLHGEGWILELKDNWRLEPAERKGDFYLKNIEK